MLVTTLCIKCTLSMMASTRQDTYGVNQQQTSKWLPWLKDFSCSVLSGCMFVWLKTTLRKAAEAETNEQ